MFRCKIFFYAGEELGLKTRASKGEAWIDEFGLSVRGTDEEFLVPKVDIKKVEMYRLHGLGRVVRIDHRKGRLFLAAIRLMIGQFALINFFRTGKLYRALLDLSARER